MRSFFLTVLLLTTGCAKDEAGSGDRLSTDVDRGGGATGDSGGTGAGSSDTGGGGPDPGGGDASPEDAIGDTLASAASLRGWESWSESVPLAIDAIDHDGDRDLYKMVLPPDTIAFLSARSLGRADLKLRVVDTSGSTIAVNRVMPHYARGGDPGIWVQARGPAPMFIEVAGESVFEGDSPYELIGFTVVAEDGEPNDTVSEASDRLSDGTAGFRSSVVGAAGHTEFLGWMGTSGDVDHWAFDAPSSGLMAWSLWTVASTVMEPSWVLTDASGAEVAWSDDPDFRGAGTWLDDVGIIAPVVAGQRYTLKVTNDRPAFGAGTLYVGAATMLEAFPGESEPNDDASMATSLGLSESSVHPGYRSGTVHGELNASDPLDVVRVELSEPGYLSVYAQAGSVGSGLAPRIELWADPDGVEVLADEVIGADGDTVITDAHVTGTEVYIRLQAHARRSETSGNQYVLGVESYPVPLHD